MPRQHRFLESSASPSATDLLVRTFFSDRQLEERMALVRQTIVRVRQLWDAERGQLAARLMAWLEELAAAEAAAAKAAAAEAARTGLPDNGGGGDAESAWPVVLARWRAILGADRNWADLQQPQPGGADAAACTVERGVDEQPPDCPVLREYTDDRSYKLVFRRVLLALRSADDSNVLPAVYLIELVNIDLFNYSRLLPPCETVVYRGMSLSEGEWASYRRLLQLPIASRFIAVPLALSSASRRAEVALQFVAQGNANEQANNSNNKVQHQGGNHGETAQTDNCVPYLQEIRVISVPEFLMQHYRRRFPQSVVSTICAVDIAEASVHPEEQEVLLRGAFFQILGFAGPKEFQVRVNGANSSHQLVTLKPNVQEILVINANRDHLSNGRLGDQDAPARALFATIVRVTRYDYCQRYCRERGMQADAAEYATALQEAEQELQRLIG